uniref:Uncharacterized protein n=1 Tax=Glossina palpalis gambiensis TaxID=67801 RepID=A0A1B0B154_9MUSC
MKRMEYYQRRRAACRGKIDLCLPLIAPIIPPGALMRLSAITIDATVIIVVISRKFTAGMIAKGVASVTFIFAQQLQFVHFLFVPNGKQIISGVFTIAWKIFQDNQQFAMDTMTNKETLDQRICLIIAVDVLVAAYLIVSQSIAGVLDYSTHPVCCRRRVTLVCKSFCKSFTAVLSETKNTAIAFNFCELEKSLSPILPPPLPSSAVTMKLFVNYRLNQYLLCYCVIDQCDWVSSYMFRIHLTTRRRSRALGVAYAPQHRCVCENLIAAQPATPCAPNCSPQTEQF